LRHHEDLKTQTILARIEFTIGESGHIVCSLNLTTVFNKINLELNEEDLQ